MRSPSVSRGPYLPVAAAAVAFAFVLSAAAIVSVIIAMPASAHTALVKITPSAGAALTTAPTEVVLEFNEPVSRTFATVAVRTAGGVSVSRGTPMVRGAKVTQPLSPDLASGAYRVAYRLVSADGHPVSGESRFTLTVTAVPSPATSAGPPSAGTLSASAAASAAASAPAATPSVRPLGALANDSQGAKSGRLSRFFVPMTGAVGLLFIAGGVLWWHRQRR